MDKNNTDKYSASKQSEPEKARPIERELATRSARKSTAKPSSGGSWLPKSSSK